MVTHKDLGTHIGALLAADGFRKRAGLIFTVELAEDVLGRVGLNTATKYTQKGEIQVSPILGVRHQTVERNVARLCDKKFHSYIPSTISAPLGYLMPERAWREWLFRPEDFTATAHEMVDRIREYGMPFLSDNATLDKTTRGIESGRRERSPESYRLSVAYFLAGKHDQAIDALDRDLCFLGDRHDAAAAGYRQFADRFRTQLMKRT
jgi:hypothetical protein